MTEHVTEPINNGDSDSDIQEIDPPILLHSTWKRRRQRILKEALIAVSVVVAQEAKKIDEGDRAAAGSFPLVQTTIQTEDKEVTSFTAVTFLTSTLISYA
jgi:hypothetical protein